MMGKTMQISDISEEVYMKEVINELKIMGADDATVALVKKETIENAIKNNRTPEDVAWAVMQ